MEQVLHSSSSLEMKGYSSGSKRYPEKFHRPDKIQIKEKPTSSMSHSVQNGKEPKNQLIKIFLESLTPGQAGLNRNRTD
ncbi:hypothetical protein LEP1GSC103_2090 [Leptospira borgpetersenii serovar Javanica str. UI 09931]|uniref:Uncharacterized protein n=4 Tax=Leptospira borgpetersenii TaxID=174 RepID=M3GIE7_LEPBO|nr:hypothetical protein C4Q31_15190 [Leptospira borgpetersenii serovar Ceylonica]EKP15501.1 hypothetical protein LEP1GSC128_0954 [Leptospira borgpetersenii str. 200801926]EKQ93579.1 hypothetical protein LEP1GSC101_0147 [Leptospira borgpetersenii str. UI 09149]EMG00747.1 hypothetical protein LEP1GSC123_0649 [Leptospira borgpetersenii str. 200701203]EMK14424.1 hypothetical protein LEP1GSC066_0578 [Leptospira sp. serovar Kenya str. Sh9]EMN14843.1 hypothetical protein LEP1GSC055_0504 [Leptospira b